MHYRLWLCLSHTAALRAALTHACAPAYMLLLLACMSDLITFQCLLFDSVSFAGQSNLHTMAGSQLAVWVEVASTTACVNALCQQLITPPHKQSGEANWCVCVAGVYALCL